MTFRIVMPVSLSCTKVENTFPDQVKIIIHQHTVIRIQNRHKAAPQLHSTLIREHSRFLYEACVSAFVFHLSFLHEARKTIPEDLRGFAVFPFGYPAQEKEQQDCFSAERIRWQ